MLKVSIQSGLNEIKEHLSHCGYDVVDMDDCVQPVQAVIYRAEPVEIKRAFREPHNTVMINAANLTKEEVVNSLNNLYS